jgi:hypothetical protein
VSDSHTIRDSFPEFLPEAEPSIEKRDDGSLRVSIGGKYVCTISGSNKRAVSTTLSRSISIQPGYRAYAIRTFVGAMQISGATVTRDP